MIVLGIETSCDETAAAVVNDGREILSHVLLTQLEDHRPYGGVVPEIAARAHLDYLDGIVTRAMADANLAYDDLDGIAATAGPGLIGGVMVGLMTGKAIALAANKPLIAVNHLEGHALTARLTDDVQFPFLLLLVSGGHCQILFVRDVGNYDLLGQTLDDAVGEAFDKVARMLGLGYPGGPQLEKLLVHANPVKAAEISLPRPMLNRPNCDFSFAGLKTAARQFLEKRELTEADKADFSLAFHVCVADILLDRLERAFAHPVARQTRLLVVAGGVAANQFLAARLKQFCTEKGCQFVAPPIKLCMDNAAMIAWAGIEKLRKGQVSPLDVAGRPRWPLYAEGSP